MGYILPEIYQSICNDSKQELPKVFVETGTFKGGIPHRIMETTGQLDACFDTYYTIELGEDICRVASKRYHYFEEFNCKPSFDMMHTDEQDENFSVRGEYFDGRLNLINGDSAIELTKLLDTINEPVCFWLDAHAGAQKYARGTKDVPLLQELEVIKNHPIKNHIIAIDDAHLFGESQTDRSGTVICDYRDVTFERIREKILEINPKYDVEIGRAHV